MNDRRHKFITIEMELLKAPLSEVLAKNAK
jgi:ribosomal protein S6 kinase alpha-5